MFRSMKATLLISFLFMAIVQFAQDSCLVVLTDSKSDTILVNSVKGVVYRNQYFIQGSVVSKNVDHLMLDAQYLDSNRNEVDTLMMVFFEDISAIVYSRQPKTKFGKSFLVKNKKSKITRLVLMVAGASSIIFTRSETATLKNYIVPVVLIPLGLLYHAIIEFDIIQTKKVKLKKGLSVIK